MGPDSQADRVPLDRTTFLKLTGAAGTIIACVSGCLWITRDGSPEDTLLQAGEHYRVADATRVIATAFEPSVAKVSKPVERPRAKKADAADPLFDPAAWRRLCAVGD